MEIFVHIFMVTITIAWYIVEIVLSIGFIYLITNLLINFIALVWSSLNEPSYNFFVNKILKKRKKKETMKNE
jgi:hypothetical protein